MAAGRLDSGQFWLAPFVPIGQPLIDLFASATDFLHGFFHRSGRSAGLLRCIADFVILSARHQGTVLFPSAARYRLRNSVSSLPVRRQRTTKLRSSSLPSGRNDFIFCRFAARDAYHRRLRARRQQVGWHLSGPPQRRELICAGKVDHGFDKVSAADLRKRLTPRTQPYSKRIAHKGIWDEPELLAEIEYGAKSRRAKCGIRSLRA
jgi:hypothetical protein